MLVVGVAGVVLSNHELARFHTQEVEISTRITGQQLQLRLQSCIEPRIAAINLLAAQPWESVPALIARWDNLAYPMSSMLPGIQAINFVDADWVIRHVYPATPNLAALGVDLSESDNPTVVASLARAEQTEELVRTNPVELLQSGLGFVLYRKLLSPEGEHLGFVNSVFRIDDLVSACFFEQDLLDRFAFNLQEADSTVIYRGGAVDAELAQEMLSRNLVNVGGRSWTIELIPTQSFLIGEGNVAVQFWRVLGMLLVVLLAFITRALLNKQDSLKTSQDRYRLLVENQSDLLVEVDTQGEFRYVSPSYCRLFDKSESELLSSDFMPLVHEDDRESTRESLEQLSSRTPQSYHEQRAMTRMGWRWLGWSNTAVLDEQGQLQGITAVGRDITEIKRLEQQVAQSAKMQAIGELAGGVTHDLNNLLHVTLANVELLLERVTDAESNERLRNIRRVISSGMELSGKLSTLSRQGPALTSQFDLNLLVMDAYNLLANTMGENIQVDLCRASQPLIVEGDKTQLERIILNLIINARDALEDGGNIEVSLSRLFLSADFCRPYDLVCSGEFAKICVSDNGIGIDSTHLPRIFDPFFTTKESDKGTGLGLSNCYSIIKQHQGLIQVDSEVGEGTTFTVFLPLASTLVKNSKADVGDTAKVERQIAAEAAVDQELAPKVPDKKRASGIVHRLLLIVDDNTDILALTRSFSESADYTVITCESGQEAVDLFAKRRDEIALVIMDMMMPGMSGTQAAAQIQKLDPKVNLLFMSGFFHEQEDAMRELNFPLLRKPFTRAELIDQIKLMID